MSLWGAGAPAAGLGAVSPGAGSAAEVLVPRLHPGSPRLSERELEREVRGEEGGRGAALRSWGSGAGQPTSAPPPPPPTGGPAESFRWSVKDAAGRAETQKAGPGPGAATPQTAAGRGERSPCGETESEGRFCGATGTVRPVN